MRTLFHCGIFAFVVLGTVRAQVLPPIDNVAAQPLISQIRRITQALDYLGQPLAEKQKAALAAAFSQDEDAKVVTDLQKVLDPLCLMAVNINPESRVKVKRGPAAAKLVEQGWTVFLVRVHNQAGVTSALKVSSPNAQSMHNSPKKDLRHRWADIQMYDGQPMQPTLGGLELEYRLVQIYSRDPGKREAKIGFDVGQGTQDIGFRNEVDILFTAQPAYPVKLEVLDENRKPTTACFEIRDPLGRVYPAQSKRYAPDFAFHPQVYRKNGEDVKLPAGRFHIKFYRGPESITEQRQVEITPETRSLRFQVKRWIDPAARGWWSGDHHIHAAGCAHYTSPSEGVHAPDMMRHCLGEDLKVGANLTWGPCFDYQKQFFTGKTDPVSQYPYLLRYDVEISGFGSHQSGHLCLLRLKDQIYPGGDSKHHWPTLCLNSLRWAQAQGSVAGPAHSGWGLEVATDELPNFELPPFNGIGANEYIVDVTHEVPGPDGKPVPAVDFISTVDTPYVWELNIWYHALNCGYRTRISGETDFPCIYGERVGLGRSYVKLDDKLDYDAWCQGVSEGRNYVGDGRSHLMEFKVNDLGVGEKGSMLKLDKPDTVKVKVLAAALLSDKPDPALRDKPYQQKPYWHIERARKGDSREVTVELLQNGYPVATKDITADGSEWDIQFDREITRSSWLAVRILPSSHTNPVFVEVEGKPIRASRRSAQWCLDGVDKCWSEKKRFIAPGEMEDALAAYDHARDAYRRILTECEFD